MDWGPVSTYLWGYTPYLNVFCVRLVELSYTGPDPNHLLEGRLKALPLANELRKDIFALFSGSAPNLPL